MLTRDQIRGYLDQLGLSSRIDDDGDLMIALDPDENFGHPVLINIIVEPNRVSFIGAALGYEPAGDPLVLANRNNARRNYPTAVIRNGQVRMEYSVYISEEVSDDFIRNFCLRSVMSSIWSAYVDLEKENID